MLRPAAVAELRQLVEEEGAGFPAIAWVWRALEARGKLLSPGEGFGWGLLPLAACQAAGGDPSQALPLGVALECFMAAADIFDDIQDTDAPDSLWLQCGLGTATNVGTFLLFLTQLAIDRLSRRGVPCEKVAEIAQSFAAAGARGCCGQQRDLEQTSEQGSDEGQYLTIVAQKSASLVECACRSGALLGTVGPAALAAYAQFGFNVGMALQIVNDLAGVSTESAFRNDLSVGKRTLPVIFALDCAPEPIRQELWGLLEAHRLRPLQPAEAERARDLMAAVGSLQYARVVADVYWERALGCLEAAGCPSDSPLHEMVAQMRGQ